MAGYTCQHIALDIIFKFFFNYKCKVWMNKPLNMEERVIYFAFKARRQKQPKYSCSKYKWNE